MSNLQLPPRPRRNFGEEYEDYETRCARAYFEAGYAAGHSAAGAELAKPERELKDGAPYEVPAP